MIFKRKHSHTNRQDNSNWQSYLFIVPPFVFLFFTLVWPIIYLLFLSLTKWNGMGEIKFVLFDNYVNIFNDNRVWHALSNNLKWSFGALIIPPLVGLSLAILLTRFKIIVGRNLFRLIYFLPQILAVAITAIIWRWIYATNGGPLNTLLGSIGLPSNTQWLANSNLALPAVFIAYVWMASGFSMLIFEAGIACIDESLFECAKIDGANWFQEIIYILLPMIRQAIVTVVTVTAIWSFQIFDLIYLTTAGGPGDATQVLSLLIYNSTFRSREIGRSSALSVLLLLIVLILATFLFKLNQNNESEKCK